jgi:hypothetical protein
MYFFIRTQNPRPTFHLDMSIVQEQDVNYSPHDK